MLEAFRASPWVRTSCAVQRVRNCVAAQRKLPDEILQTLVVRVPAGFCTHDRDTHFRELIPVGIELSCGRVQELEPGQVGCAPPVADDR